MTRSASNELCDLEQVNPVAYGILLYQIMTPKIRVLIPNENNLTFLKDKFI